MRRVAAEAAAVCLTVRHVIVAHGPPHGKHSSAGSRIQDWDDLVASEPGDVPTAVLDPESPLMIAYTSGTTGRPKGAVHVHGGFLVKVAQEVAHQVDMREDDRLYWVTDLGWIMGPWEIVGGLAAGGTVILAEGVPDYPATDRLWGIVERHEVTILGVSPTLIRALMRHGTEPIRSHDLSTLRILASTGEPWDPESWRWLFDHAGGRRSPIINISGGTEVGACLLSALPITPLKPCSLVGPALGMAVDVFDTAGKPLRHGVGELVCTKPWPAMTRGIWGDPERYLATYWSRWPEVWVHGDWASIDEDGDWFLHGRSDDTLNVAGKRLGPAEVESILAEHDAIAESAAVGIPDPVKGEVIHCFAVLCPGYEPTDSLRSELRERVACALGKSFAPDRVRFVAELPKTRSGKILRRLVRCVALGQPPGDLSSIENFDALEAIRRAD
jgi:acetyl-CoA synthetase